MERILSSGCDLMFPSTAKLSDYWTTDYCACLKAGVSLLLLHPNLNIPTGLPNVEVAKLAHDVLCTWGPGLR